MCLDQDVYGLCVCDLTLSPLTSAEKIGLTRIVCQIPECLSPLWDYSNEETYCLTDKEQFILLDFLTKKGRHFFVPSNPCRTETLTECVAEFCDHGFFFHFYPETYNWLIEHIQFYSTEDPICKSHFDDKNCVHKIQQIYLALLCQFWCVHSTCILSHSQEGGNGGGRKRFS